jgi:hypothetical protein
MSRKSKRVSRSGIHKIDLIIKNGYVPKKRKGKRIDWAGEAQATLGGLGGEPGLL